MGAAHALKLASEGADVVLFDVPTGLATVPYPLGTRAELEDVARRVKAIGREALIVEGDVRSQADLDGAVAQAISTFGKLDFLVANAGIWTLAPTWEMTEEQWTESLDVNLSGQWRSVKAVVPHMMERRQGAIVLISSINGMEGLPNSANYAAAKHGLIGLMRTVALDMGPYNVRCNSVLPGFINTPIHKWQGAYDYMAGHEGGTDADRIEAARYYGILAGRGPLNPTSVSNAVLFLLSQESADVTGLALPVDAGHLALPHFNPAPLPPQS